MQPRGFRNNNFGNIVDGSFARSLPGYAGNDGRFARFDSPEAGIGAMSRLLDSYARRGFDTTERIINRWAPPNENPTGALVNTQARRLGLAPGDRVDFSDPAIRARFINGLIEQENGRTLPMDQVRAAVGGEPMYRPPLDPGMMSRAQSALGRYGTLQPPANASFLGAFAPLPSSLNAPAPTGGAGSMAPYAPSTPLRSPSLDEQQIGGETAVAAAPAGEADWGKVASGLKGLADAMKPPPEARVDMPAPMVNKPQTQGLPQMGSNQLLLQLAKARSGGQRPMAPMAGLLGG